MRNEIHDDITGKVVKKLSNGKYVVHSDKSPPGTYQTAFGKPFCFLLDPTTWPASELKVGDTFTSVGYFLTTKNLGRTFRRVYDVDSKDPRLWDFAEVELGTHPVVRNPFANPPKYKPSVATRGTARVSPARVRGNKDTDDEWAAHYCNRVGECWISSYNNKNGKKRKIEIIDQGNLFGKKYYLARPKSWNGIDFPIQENSLRREYKQVTK